MENNKLTKEIDYFLRNINKLIIEYTKNQLSDNKLTLSRFKVLWVISELQPLNMSSLHEEVFLANSTLTAIVDRLVKDNLVMRYRDSEDRRVVLLKVSDKGKECLAHILEIRQEFLQEILKGLGEAEQLELIKLLKPILKGIEEEMNLI